MVPTMIIYSLMGHEHIRNNNSLECAKVSNATEILMGDA